jgi:dolichol-phosphate mannosyltransferase
MLMGRDIGRDISIMTPVYNEKDNLPTFIRNLEQALAHDNRDFEIIIIEDNSPDGSGEIADDLAKKYENIKVIHRREKLGLGTAYKDGFKEALGDLIVTIDCDLSHDPSDLPLLLEEAREKDIVVGSRLIKGGEIKGRTIWRDILSYSANWFIKLITGYPIRDWTSGYRVYKREVLEEVFPQVECMKWDFQFDVLYVSLLSGFSVKEKAITFRDRGGGKSKFDLHEAFTFVTSVLRIIFKR